MRPIDTSMAADDAAACCLAKVFSATPTATAAAATS